MVITTIRVYFSKQLHFVKLKSEIQLTIRVKPRMNQSGSKHLLRSVHNLFFLLKNINDGILLFQDIFRYRYLDIFGV